MTQPHFHVKSYIIHNLKKNDKLFPISQATDVRWAFNLTTVLPGLT